MRPVPPTEPTAPRSRSVRLRTVVRAAFADTRPLRTPAYRRLWTAGIVTTVGAQLSVVAVPTQIFQLTGSSAWVGLAGLFGLVPLVVLQTVATDEMRGRMQGLFIVVVAGGPRVADLWHGPAAALVGTGVAATAGGVAVVLGTLLVVRRYPEFWRYRASA